MIGALSIWGQLHPQNLDVLGMHETLEKTTQEMQSEEFDNIFEDTTQDIPARSNAILEKTTQEISERHTDKILNDDEAWSQCIQDIQRNIKSNLSDLFVSEKKGKIILIDPNIRRNVGDNLITYGELVFLDSLGYKDFKECGIAQIEFEPCNYSDFDDESVEMGMWHGGGNWGNLYNKLQRQPRRLKSLVEIAKRGKKVLGMPQSLYYDNKDEELDDAKMFQRKLDNALDSQTMFERIVLTWRQQDSFDRAKVTFI